MIVICPSCSTSYDVDEAVYGRQPRIVECSACGTRWQQEPGFQLPLDEERPPESPRGEAAAESVPLPGPSASPSPSPSPLIDDEPSLAVATSSPTMPLEGSAVAEPAVIVAPLTAADETPPTVDAADEGAVSLRERLLASMDRPPSGDAGGETSAAAAEATSASVTGEPTAVDAALHAEAAAYDRQQRWRRLILPLVIGAVVVIILAATAFLARGVIVAAIPAADAIYRSAGGGPGVAADGLHFRDVRKTREWHDGEEVLIVTGLLFNGGTTAVTPPAVRVVLLDGDEVELQSMAVAIPSARITPGQSVPFETRIVSPALAAEHIRLSLGPPAP